MIREGISKRCMNSLDNLLVKIYLVVFYSKSFSQAYIHEWPANAFKNPLVQKSSTLASEYINIKVLLASSSYYKNIKNYRVLSMHSLITKQDLYVHGHLNLSKRGWIFYFMASYLSKSSLHLLIGNVS